MGNHWQNRATNTTMPTNEVAIQKVTPKRSRLRIAFDALFGLVWTTLERVSVTSNPWVNQGEEGVDEHLNADHQERHSHDQHLQESEVTGVNCGKQP